MNLPAVRKMPRPTRRSLSRQARHLPPALVLSQVLRLAEQSTRPRADTTALEALFSAIWRQSRDSVWTCAELRDHGLLPAAATRSTGRALAALHEAGGRLGGFLLLRHHSDRTGRLWQLRRMW